MAHEREANDADGLEQLRFDDREPFGRIALQVRRDVWSLEKDRGDDDEHTDERKARGAREFVDVAVQRERVGDAYGAEDDDELSIGKYGQEGRCSEGREGVADDMGYGVTYSGYHFSY